MNLPRYPKYKNSGVEWLGDVPHHWATTSLGRVTLEKCDGPFGSGLKSEHYAESGVRVIRLQNIRRDGFDSANEAFVEQAYFREGLARHGVRQGDLLVAGLGDDTNTVGRACVAPSGIEPAMVKADCFRFRLDSARVLPEFVAMQLSASSVADAAGLSSGSTRSRISLSVMASRRLVLPPLSEQRAIATFLQQETAKIDALVAEQRRLIGVLKEKRQAVISDAVMKGLNPNTSMKPSGIEWLGEVPAHWEVTPVKHLVTMSSGGTPSKSNLEYWDGTVPWASSKDLKTEELSDTEDHLTTAALSVGAADLVPTGSVLIVVRGMILAHTFPVTKTLVDMAINQDLKALTPFPLLDADYLAWLLRGSAREILARVDEAAHGTAVLRMEAWASMLLPVPPIEEQRKITSKLVEQLRRLDKLKDHVQRATELLLERRVALISAAVNGKIDVRSALATSE